MAWCCNKCCAIWLYLVNEKPHPARTQWKCLLIVLLHNAQIETERKIINNTNSRISRVRVILNFLQFLSLIITNKTITSYFTVVSYLAHVSNRQSTELSKNKNPSMMVTLSWKCVEWIWSWSSLSVAKKHLGRRQW